MWQGPWLAATATATATATLRNGDRSTVACNLVVMPALFGGFGNKTCLLCAHRVSMYSNSSLIGFLCICNNTYPYRLASAVSKMELCLWKKESIGISIVTVSRPSSLNDLEGKKKVWEVWSLPYTNRDGVKNILQSLMTF